VEYTAIRDLNVAAFTFSRGTRRALRFLSVLCSCAVVAGCAFARSASVPVHEDPKGSVYLERVPGGALHASHPIQLDNATLDRALSGPRVEEDRLFEDLGIGRGKFPPFSEDEVKYLSPFVAEALTRATSEQVVGVRVVHLTGNGIKTTEGVLWVEKPFLHLTLTRYLADAGRRPTVYRDEPGPRDSTGLKGKTVTFVPEGAARATYPRDLPLLASPHLTTLVIDYERLAKLPTTTEARPSRPAIPATEARPRRPAPPATEARPSGPSQPSIDHGPSRPAAPVTHEQPSRPTPPATTDEKPSRPAAATDTERPRPKARTEATSSTTERAETPEAVIKKKDREIEALKAKVRALQQQLERQGAEPEQ
jgi:hypothetical protein